MSPLDSGGGASLYATVAGAAREDFSPRSYKTQTDHEIYLQFRIEQIDEVGNTEGYTAVVASGSSPEELPDFIADGDDVEVTGVVTDGPVEAYELTNLTTGTTVTLQHR